jgi:hypothetical protein
MTEEVYDGEKNVLQKASTQRKKEGSNEREASISSEEFNLDPF